MKAPNRIYLNPVEEGDFFGGVWSQNKCDDNSVEYVRKGSLPKWLYRLEFRDGTCGLWYDGGGRWCFDSGIGSLDDSCKTKTLPMGYDERYKQDGRDWFSSCSRKEDLLHWYSKEDARKLLDKGFVFTRYLATEYHEYDQQTVFIKETALFREEIDFFSLMGEQPEVDLEKEIARFALNGGTGDNTPTIGEVARHFYNLGLNGKK